MYPNPWGLIYDIGDSNELPLHWWQSWHTLNLSKCHQSCLLWQTKYFCSDGSAVRNICNKVLDWFKGHCMKHKLELQQRDHTCLLFQGPNFYPCKDWERYCDCETGTIGLLHNHWLVHTSLMTGTVNLGPAVSQVVLLCRTCCDSDTTVTLSHSVSWACMYSHLMLPSIYH